MKGKNENFSDYNDSLLQNDSEDVLKIILDSYQRRL